MEDLITLVNKTNERGVSFHSLEENITMINQVLQDNYYFIYSQHLQDLNVI